MNFYEIIDAIFKTILDYNYIFYILAFSCFFLWIVDNFLGGILEFKLLYGLDGIVGSIGCIILYFALCNTCYFEEYYNKNI